MTIKKNVLELNNVDLYGKRFNGYSIAKYAHKHPDIPFAVCQLVNHKIGHDHFVFPLFSNESLEKYDYRLDSIENILGTKNQFSITEEAIMRHPLFKTADILHFHMYHNMHLPIEFLLRIPKEKQIIIDLHDTFWLTDNSIPMLEVFQASNINKTSLNKQRNRVLHNIDAHFIVHSPYMQKFFKASSATAGLSSTMIPFGIDTDVYKPLDCVQSLRQQYHIPTDHSVLFFRAQKEFKGLTYIIDALSSLKGQKFTLITVGSKGELGILPKLFHTIEFGLVDTDTKMTELYNLCDIFLSPSTEESFGFMAIEAMSCEKPVIVFDGTALPTTTNAPSIGISVPKTAVSLQKAILSLISNPAEQKSRGKAGRKYVLSHYQEKAYIDANLSLYQKITDSPHRSMTKHSFSDQGYSLSSQPFSSIVRQLNSPFSSIISTPPIVNYNDPKIQQTISEINSNLYNNFSNSDAFTSIKTKSLLRQPIKTIKRKLTHHD